MPTRIPRKPRPRLVIFRFVMLPTFLPVIVVA
jgi:hypothetical protein